MNFAQLGILVESRSLEVADDRLDKFGRASDKAQKATDKVTGATDRRRTATDRANRATATETAATERNTQATNRKKTATDRAANANSKYARSAQVATKAMNGMSTAGARMVRNLAATAIAFVGIQSGIATLTKFESGMARVQAVTGATTQEFEGLRQTARDLGAVTEFSASEVADGLGFLGMAGFEATEAIAAMPAVLDLATSGQLDLGRAADIASNIMSGFGLAATEASGAIDIMATVATSSNTTIEKLGSAMALVAPVAQSAGIELKEVAAAVGILSDAGIQGTRAGTSLRQAIAYLVKPSDDAKGAIKDLGLSLADVDPTTQSLVAVFSKLGDAGLDTAGAMRIFGIEGSAGALRLASAASELGTLTDELGNVEGAAKSMADIFRESLGGSFATLRSATESLMLTMGDAGLTAALKGVVTGLTAVIGALDRGIAAISNWSGEFNALGAVVATVSTAIGIRFVARLVTANRTMTIASTAAAGLGVAFRAIQGASAFAGAAVTGIFAGGLTRAATAAVLTAKATGILKTAVGALGVAVRVAGGPWTLLASAIVGAASYFGLFESGAEDAAQSVDRTKEAVDELNKALGEFNDDKSEVTADNALSIARALNEETKSTLAAAAASYELTKAKMTALRTNLSSNPLTADVENTGYGSDVMAQVEAAAKRVAKAQEDADLAATKYKETLDTIQGKNATRAAEEMEGAVVSLSEAMELLEDRTNAFTGLADVSTAPIDDLMQKYGVLADQLREPLKLQMEIAEQGAIEQAKVVSGEVAKQFNLALSELSLEEPTRKIIGPLELTNGEVEKLRIGIHGITQSSGPDELAVKIGTVATELGNAYGNAEKIPAPMRELLNTAIDAARQIGLISQNASAATGNINGASNAAASLANNLRTALGNIAAIANTNISLNLDVVGMQAQNKALSEGKDKYDAMADAAIATRRAQLSGIGGLGAQVAEVREAAEASLSVTEQLERQKAKLNRENATLTSTTSRGGGGGSSKTTTAQDEVARLSEAYDSLMSSLDPVYEKTLNLRDAEDMLSSAVKAGIIGVEEKRKATELLEESYDDLSGVGATVRDMMTDTFSSIITGASSAKDAVAQLATALANMALQKGFEQLFDNSGVTSGLGDFFGNVLGWNAKGTDNWRGGLTVVGEEGPEIVNLPKGSQIINNRKSKELARKSVAERSTMLGGIGEMAPALGVGSSQAQQSGITNSGSAPVASQFVPAATSSPSIEVNVSRETSSLDTGDFAKAATQFADVVPKAARALVGLQNESSEVNVSGLLVRPDVSASGSSDPSDGSRDVTSSPRFATQQAPAAPQAGLGGPRARSGLGMAPVAPQTSPISLQAPPAAPAAPAAAAPSVEVKVEPRIYFDRDKLVGDYLKSPGGRMTTMTVVEEEGAQR